MSTLYFELCVLDVARVIHKVRSTKYKKLSLQVSPQLAINRRFLICATTFEITSAVNHFMSDTLQRHLQKSATRCETGLSAVGKGGLPPLVVIDFPSKHHTLKQAGVNRPSQLRLILSCFDFASASLACRDLINQCRRSIKSRQAKAYRTFSLHCRKPGESSQ